MTNDSVFMKAVFWLSLEGVKIRYMLLETVELLHNSLERSIYANYCLFVKVFVLRILHDPVLFHHNTGDEQAKTVSFATPHNKYPHIDIARRFQKPDVASQFCLTRPKRSINKSLFFHMNNHGILSTSSRPVQKNSTCMKPLGFSKRLHICLKRNGYLHIGSLRDLAGLDWTDDMPLGFYATLD